MRGTGDMKGFTAGVGFGLARVGSRRGRAAGDVPEGAA